MRERAQNGVAAAPAILDVRSVTKRFGGVVALNEVDLVVPRGAIIGLIGPNGAGKTTLFNVVTGLVRPDGGRMIFDGGSLVGLRPNAIVVPEDAILPMQGATYVWVVKEGKADRRQVTLGVRTAGWAPEVLTMITVQRALCDTRLGILPRRNSRRPAMPRLPTTTASIISVSMA